MQIDSVIDAVADVDRVVAVAREDVDRVLRDGLPQVDRVAVGCRRTRGSGRPIITPRRSIVAADARIGIGEVADDRDRAARDAVAACSSSMKSSPASSDDSRIQRDDDVRAVGDRPDRGLPARVDGLAAARRRPPRRSPRHAGAPWLVSTIVLPERPTTSLSPPIARSRGRLPSRSRSRCRRRPRALRDAPMLVSSASFEVPIAAPAIRIELAPLTR